ncbi:hypothetical protein [Rhodococcus sp. BH5]|uniref:hypothetical protein n=1 Tax=Rhodococcus sp. BH5 TaxID=2871702 RepID=UPI0022CD581F|nr:hypothetical protein [Rhodococcus sp. BH5]MCZ9635277.1 hypothetical protein [Rhodococcus sp. BH5]
MVRWNGDRKIFPFSLRVELDKRVYRTIEDREPFVANFNGANGDLLHLISAFVEALPDAELVERDERHFGQPTDILRAGRTISWRMDGGESGRASKIRLRKGDQPQDREPSGVEWSPYWVYAVIPNNSNQGWLLVEKDGRYSLPAEWRKELIRQFAATYRGYRLVIGTVREDSLWRQVENAMEEARLLGFEVALRSPDTTAASGGAQGYSRGMVEVNRRIYKAVDGPLPGVRLRQFRRPFMRQHTADGLREIEFPLETDDLADDSVKIRFRDDVVEIKATVLNADGQERTIAYDGLDAQQSYVMEGTADGQPSQEKFRRECRTAVTDLAKAGGVTLQPGWESTEWTHPDTAPRLQIRVSDEGEASS